MGKVVTLDELGRVAEECRAEGRIIVLTNGCFDLLHVGHVRYLQEARQFGDVLIVGVNEDRVVRQLKGPGRPIVPADERAEMLAALAVVDYVVVFGEPTADVLVEAVRPDVYVKGGDWTPERLPEAPTVARLGGRIAIVPYLPGRSTRALIEAAAALQESGD